MTEAIINTISSNQSLEDQSHTKKTRAIKITCRIIGVLDDGIKSISAQSLYYIKQADVIIGGTRTLELFKSYYSSASSQLDLTGNITKIPFWIKTAQQNNQHVVVLATGDPLCHGIAKYIKEKIDFATCEIHPNVSTIQHACARIGLAWQDLKICSAHNKDTGEWQTGSDSQHSLYFLLQQLHQHDKLAVFTSPENSPDRIARMLKTEGFESDFTLTVVENILRPDENIIEAIDINTATKKSFANLNIVILQRINKKTNSVILGCADHLYKQRKPNKGLITKREVRVVSLARMQLHQNSIVWDIGAGSGSVGLEASRLCPNGHVYAIEKNTEDFNIASQNKKAMRVTNYTLVNAKAPALLELWPDPDAIFIGGSGGELAELISICISRMLSNACLVMNFVTIENMATAVESLKSFNITWDVTQLSAARSKPILHMNRLQAENPVWIVTAQKQVDENEQN